MAGLTIKTTDLPNGVRIALEGDASPSNVQALDQELIRIEEMSPALVAIDLTKLDFISTPGMVAFLRLRRVLANNKGVVRLGGAKPIIIDAFRRSNLHQVLEFVDSV